MLFLFPNMTHKISSSRFTLADKDRDIYQFDLKFTMKFSKLCLKWQVLMLRPTDGFIETWQETIQ